ncbi:MAG: molybdate ABC transporter substrate-binding protein [Thermoleophilia bacterium]
MISTSLPRRRARHLLALLALGLVAVLAPTADAAGTGSRITVLAAASLTEVFPRIDATPRFSFAGSGALATQIRQGAPADVFATADPIHTQRLFDEGLVEKPVGFAFNRVILIVPTANPANIRSVYDLRRSGVKLVIGANSVPVGAYTRTILRNLGLSSVLSNVVSQESDVKGVLAKVALGEADAGFVYVTDARAAASQVKGLAIPVWAQPRVRYEVAVVRSTANRAAAANFVARVRSAKGRAQLKAAGFLLAPLKR